MLIITDNFDLISVDPMDVPNIRFENMTAEQVKVACKDVKPTMQFTNEHAAATVSELVGLPIKCFEAVIKLNPTDVMIVTNFAKSKEDGARPGSRRYYRVTCRRDYEVFNLGGYYVILDRDAVPMTAAINPEDAGVEELNKLYERCEEFNKSGK